MKFDNLSEVRIKYIYFRKPKKHLSKLLSHEYSFLPNNIFDKLNNSWVFLKYLYVDPKNPRDYHVTICYALLYVFLYS